jgi:hypothetical protein
MAQTIFRSSQFAHWIAISYIKSANDNVTGWNECLMAILNKTQDVNTRPTPAKSEF